MGAIPSLGRQHDMRRPSLDLRPRRPAAHAGNSSNPRRPSKRASVRSRPGRGSTPNGPEMNDDVSQRCVASSRMSASPGLPKCKADLPDNDARADFASPSLSSRMRAREA